MNTKKKNNIIVKKIFFQKSKWKALNTCVTWIGRNIV